MCVGVMRHAFDAALSFCRSDMRGGTKRIIEHQSVSDGLIDVKMTIEAARAVTWRAMSVLEHKDENVGWDARLEAAVGCKVWCSSQVVGVVEKCMGVVGM
jgi:alkylation response protein AidB-like acyl-CoA dehydrogenase